MNNDPWKHRSSVMQCQTCMWYVPKVDENDEEYNIGRCRKNAPTMDGYPVVFYTDWCGAHKLNESAV